MIKIVYDKIKCNGFMNKEEETHNVLSNICEWSICEGSHKMAAGFFSFFYKQT